jgi:hypothetical protein
MTPGLRRNSSDRMPVCEGVRLTSNTLPDFASSTAEPEKGSVGMSTAPPLPTAFCNAAMTSVTAPRNPANPS